MNILLTGASGFIGHQLTATLETAGHRVTPASRRNGVDFCTMRTVDDWLPHLKGIDAVINAVGIIGEQGRQRFAPLHHFAPAALFRACSVAGIRRIVQISALGADHTAFSPYHLSKRAADDVLRGLDLDWFVLRPSLIYGRSGTSARLFMRLARLPLIPVFGDGQQALQPIHISDVVATVLRALVSPEARQTLDIVGSETVGFGDWLQTLRQAQGLPPARFLHIPFPLAMGLSRVGRHVCPLLQPNNLRMLRIGYWADGAPWVRFMGRPPAAVAAPLFFSDLLPARSAS